MKAVRDTMARELVIAVVEAPPQMVDISHLSTLAQQFGAVA